ncbi:MAG: efflux RND transporter periplasmic adaptor subunit [Sphingobacteriales bacterium]|nr:MAG: efflux RND transporter periplasmic adaptor subunit [Sphingobacteriales bacterium]
MKFQIIASAMITLCLAACSSKQEPQQKKAGYALSDAMQKQITIDSVTYCHISDELSLSGEVSFNENNMVKIFPRSSGQVIETRVSLGDKVSKGQVLAVVRSADVAGNYSDLSSTRADVSIAKRQLDNAEALYQSGISSEREFTEAKQNYEKAVAGKDKVQSVININGGGKTSASGDYMITAPIDGYVVEKKITSGAFIRPDMGDNLFTISDLKNVWIFANVYETDIAKVKEGYAVKVVSAAYPDKVFTGTIDKIGQVLDPQSKAMRVRITLSNNDLLLKPDMFAKVIVSNSEGAQAICIPTSALISQDGKDFVVVYQDKADMSIAEVQVLKTVNDRTYLSAGVSPGMKLITSYQNLVFNQLRNP